MSISLDYFLLIRDVEFFGANLIFLVRIMPNSKQQQEQTANTPLRALAFNYPLKSPQNSRSKLCASGRVTPLPENKSQPAAVDSLKQPRIPPLGLKRLFSPNVSVF